MNPYKVLGVPEGAGEETIKKAYYDLVKKYHPDRYNNNPLKDLAEEKLKEINKAYDILTGGARADSHSGASDSYGRGETHGQYADVRKLIQLGRLDEAMGLLEQKDKNTAEYHYLVGIICMRKGFYDKAVFHLNTAVNMDPHNAEYQYAKNNMYNRTNAYRNVNVQRGGCASSPCDCCTSLLCADCCCECMGGDLISCC